MARPDRDAHRKSSASPYYDRYPPLCLDGPCNVDRYRKVLTYQTCPAEEALVARPYLAPSGVYNWAEHGPADMASRIIVPHVSALDSRIREAACQTTFRVGGRPSN